MRTTPIEVTSGPHTYLGGVLIDEWGRTTVQGLYAGGEATGGVHGANRTGGAALADSYVFGLRSGMCAACESRLRERLDPEDGGWRERFDLLKRDANRRGSLSPGEWRRQLQRLVIASIGQVRRGDRLKEALTRLGEFERNVSEVSIAGETTRERLESLRWMVETRNLIAVARMLATAALFREESRGGHFRLDFPNLNDANWLCNIVLREEEGGVVPRRREVAEEDQLAPEPPGVPSTAASLD
jgi:fumarate reductase (CoM/CoB) subunit A